MPHAPNEDLAIQDITQLGLLNLLNELRKRDQMRGLLSMLFLFCNEFNTSNNTRARM